MDKETLSNYGWIVIAVLVLAVMIALATPFGQFIATSVQNTTEALFDTKSNALDAAGVEHMQAEFENAFNESFKDPAMNPTNTIPDGAFYGNINLEIFEITWYTEMPTTVSEYDVYFYGDYVYLYSETMYGGWSVTLATEDVAGLCPIGFELTDKNQTTYGAILESINGKPIMNMSSTFADCTSLTTAPAIPSSVTDMFQTFMDCTSLTTAPVIPSSVTDMSQTFWDCTALVTAPVIPNGVTDMEQTFWGCTALVTAPVIPNGVTDMSYTFADCTSLTTAPAIPSSVTDMFQTFMDCTSLTTAPTIPSSVTTMNGTFADCTSLKTYAGSTDPDGDFSNYVIPSSVTDMSQTFYGCTNLTTAPTIPSSVTTMFNTFQNCTSLVTAPAIPSSVTNMTMTFFGCTALTGTVEINTNSIDRVKNENGIYSGDDVGLCHRCFYNVDMTNITLTGEASKDVLNLIGSTGNNWTPIS